MDFVRRAAQYVIASVSATMTRKNRTAEAVGVPSEVCMSGGQSARSRRRSRLDFGIVVTVGPDHVRGRQRPGADDDRGAERNAERRGFADPRGQKRAICGDEQDIAVIEEEQQRRSATSDTRQRRASMCRNSAEASSSRWV